LAAEDVQNQIQEACKNHDFPKAQALLEDDETNTLYWTVDSDGRSLVDLTVQFGDHRDTGRRNLIRELDEKGVGFTLGGIDDFEKNYRQLVKK
jgi:hypothetical protein